MSAACRTSSKASDTASAGSEACRVARHDVKLRAPDAEQVTKGAPVVRRQIEQWQFVWWNGAPVTS
jgi:hypothetical protein